jgi:hypothetical protein
MVKPKPLSFSSGNTIDVKSAFGYRGAIIIYKVKVRTIPMNPSGYRA